MAKSPTKITEKQKTWHQIDPRRHSFTAWEPNLGKRPCTSSLGNGCSFSYSEHSRMTKKVAQKVKNLPAIQETWVRALGQKDPLEKVVVTHSRILAWRIPWTKEPGGLQSMGSQRVRHDWETNTLTFTLQVNTSQETNLCEYSGLPIPVYP